MIKNIKIGLIGLGLLLAACGGPIESKVYQVELKTDGFNFAGKKLGKKGLFASVGDKVEFENKDIFTHKIVFGKSSLDFSSIKGIELKPGAKLVATLRNAGEINFHCATHTWEHGMISVKGVN